MHKFNDNQGITYTEQDLNSLDVMPTNIAFNSLDLRGLT